MKEVIDCVTAGKNDSSVVEYINLLLAELLDRNRLYLYERDEVYLQIILFRKL